MVFASVFCLVLSAVDISNAALPPPPPNTFHSVCTLYALTGKVPGIIDITFGPTFTTDRNQGFTHALVVDLADKAALEVSPISSCVLLPLSSLILLPGHLALKAPGKPTSMTINPNM